MSKVSRSRFPPAAAPTTVVIKHRHRPPRPRTIGYSDRNAALALQPNWPGLCIHQAFHTSNRIVRGAGPSLARTRRSWASTASRRSCHALALSLWRQLSCWTQLTFTDEARRGGEQAAGEMFTGRHVANGPRIRAQNTRGFRVLLWVGHRAVLPREVPSPASPRDSQDLDWSRESSASQTTIARMRSAKKTLWELCTAIPIQALR